MPSHIQFVSLFRNIACMMMLAGGIVAAQDTPQIPVPPPGHTVPQSPGTLHSPESLPPQTIPNAGEAPPPRSPHRDLTRTFLISQLSTLEDQLFAAVAKKDRSTLDGLLAENFEMRRSSAPGEPVPRAEWIRQAVSNYDLKGYRVEQMAVHPFEGPVLVAVASFRYRQNATLDGKDRSGDFLVIDVWIRVGTQWKLTERYSAPAEGGAPVGAGPVNLDQADQRPTGKQ